MYIDNEDFIEEDEEIEEELDKDDEPSLYELERDEYYSNVIAPQIRSLNNF